MSEQTSQTEFLLEGEGAGIIGVKAGMSQVYGTDGKSLAVTVIAVKPNIITQVKKSEKNGYSALQVGVLPKKASRVNKPENGHFKKAGVDGVYYAQEFRVANDAAIESAVEGQVLSLGVIKEGELVDVHAVSKGKGFQGVMKRHNYAGGPASHGASVSHRQIGSIGNRADPSKVFKGKKMAGQMGNVRVTIQNLKVVKVDAEKGLILVHGSVPGPKSGIVTISPAVKA